MQHRILGFDARLEYQVLPGRPGDRLLEDHPGCVGPLLALDRGVALHCRHVRLPGQHRVRGRVGERQDVRVGGRLAHGSGGEPGESCADFEQVVDRRDRHQLGARLAVHLHEHGVDELDAVVGDACLDLFGHDALLLRRAAVPTCESWHTRWAFVTGGLRCVQRPSTRRRVRRRRLPTRPVGPRWPAGARHPVAGHPDGGRRRSAMARRCRRGHHR